MKTFKQIYDHAENKITGIAAAPGIVIGPVYLYTREKLEVINEEISNCREAVKNFRDALLKAKKELSKVFELAKEKMGGERAAIFEAQLMILDDPILIETIENRIYSEKRLPEYIVDDEISKYQKMMMSAHESYMKERAHDIGDIKNRIVRNLQKKRWQSKIKKEAIVISESLSPADTVLFSRNDVKGFVTDHGGLTSHAAIISRSLNIPAVVGTHNASHLIHDGDIVIIDGFHGYILYNPDEKQISFFESKLEKLKALQRELEEYKGKPAITTDGKEIHLSANVDVSGEIDIVITSGAKGIGLYRTEQVLEELSEFPTEEEQAKIYRNLSSRVYPNNIVIRAFDIGGDKFKYYDFQEPNPFLGLRGIRLLLENKTLFKNQIRAVLQASENKNIHFMIPMVSTILEIRETKKMIEECKKELKKEGKNFDRNMKVGMMVEVPSAAVMAELFAKEVDFFSIGTNDLIQYLMAVDRGNDLVSDLYQQFSPAVIRTISYIVREAKKAKKEVSLCGEMAADTLAIPLLIGLGLESLSISPSTIAYATRIIRSISYKKAKKLAADCLSCSVEKDVIDRIEKFFEENSITRTRNLI
ncbi:MAG: phosphoenolpyruvate--protein phosphotransferase [Ignavibacteria bacterium CG_4_9_14_3_um_filter_36_18]|nr:phosphoenolpyruvate--protein phosphotransferase [Ignavibacteria bacterium]PJB00477.1 MAG: phosphoenolpyruvate--protein phosphotransferase [Ignavibacteria bacterium CG_4_9_14_3_um_filter_36_18]